MAAAPYPLRWNLGNLPRGSPGVRQTVATMKRLAERDARSFEIRSLAVSLCAGVLPYDHAGELEELHRFVRDQVRYIRDVRGVETVQSPRYTLRTAAGDCDDKVTLLASLCLAIGYPVRYVLARTQAARPQEFTHVYLEARIPRAWIALETTVPWAELGHTPPQFGPPERIA